MASRAANLGITEIREAIISWSVSRINRDSRASWLIDYQGEARVTVKTSNELTPGLRSSFSADSSFIYLRYHTPTAQEIIFFFYFGKILY